MGSQTSGPCRRRPAIGRVNWQLLICRQWSEALCHVSVCFVVVPVLCRAQGSWTITKTHWLTQKLRQSRKLMVDTQTIKIKIWTCDQIRSGRAATAFRGRGSLASFRESSELGKSRASIIMWWCARRQDHDLSVMPFLRWNQSIRISIVTSHHHFL